MWGVVCFGELFVDLVPHSEADGQWLYVPSPGGAPGNVATGLAKLGHKTLMVSRVGDDAFDKLLVDALRGYGVDVSGIVQPAAEKAGLSIVTLDE
jgi:fructokinase